MRIYISYCSTFDDELKKKPSAFIKKMHDNYLRRICDESELQGLCYDGGPLGECPCPRTRVLEFVSYDHRPLSQGTDTVDQKPKCQSCASCDKHTVDQILYAQVCWAIFGSLIKYYTSFIL